MSIDNTILVDDTIINDNTMSSNISTSTNYTCSLTSHLSATSLTDNLSGIDEEVKNIMVNNSVPNDTNIRNEVMMLTINNLYEQLSSLKDQITFLRAESLTKNSTIGQLFNELSKTQNKSVHHYPTSNSSRMLNQLMSEPQFNSSFRDDDFGTKSNSVEHSEINEAEHLVDAVHRHSTSMSALSQEQILFEHSSSNDNLSRSKDMAKVDINDQLRQVRQVKNYEYLASKNYELLASNSDKDFAAWERHSTGFGSKMLQKMGYGGGGLGKNENGIINPVIVEKKCGRAFVASEERQTSHVINRGLDVLLPKTISRGDQIQTNRVVNVAHPWPENTTLIAGSSIVSGIEESRLRHHRAKVRSFPGACVDDMYDYLAPLLRKKPAQIILHVGSNDAPLKKADDIAKEIANLKTYIERILPAVKLYLSCPVVRNDDIRANLTLRKLDKILKSWPNSIPNDNVDNTCLGKRGLHLNAKGSGRLAINYIPLMRRL